MSPPTSGGVGASTRTRAVVWTIGTRGGALVMSALAGVVVARALLPTARGEYEVAVAVALTAVSLGHLSIVQAHTALWQQGAPRAGLAANSLVLGAGVGAAVALVAAVVVVAGGGALFPSTDRWAMGIILVAIPFNVVSLYFGNLTALDDRIRRVNLGVVSASLVHAVGVVTVVAVADLTVRWAVAWRAAAIAAPTFVVAWGFGARMSDVSPRLLKRALRLGLQYHLGLAALFLLFRVDVFILNGLADQSEVGLYAIAVLVAELLVTLVATSASEVLLPRVMAGTQQEAAEFTARAFRANTVLVVASAAILAAATPLAVPAVFGEAFDGAVGPLLALLPGATALGAIGPVASFIVRLERPLFYSALVWSAFALNIGLNLLLIPSLGATGAALASSIAYVVLAASYLVWFARAEGVSAAELRPRMGEMGALTRDLFRAPSGTR